MFRNRGYNTPRNVAVSRMHSTERLPYGARSRGLPVETGRAQTLGCHLVAAQALETSTVQAKRRYTDGCVGSRAMEGKCDMSPVGNNSLIYDRIMGIASQN